MTPTPGFVQRQDQRGLLMSRSHSLLLIILFIVIVIFVIIIVATALWAEDSASVKEQLWWVGEGYFWYAKIKGNKHYRA